MKVLHLPSSVGGNAWGLSRGERALGLESSVLYSHSGWAQYPADVDLKLQTIPSKFLRFGRLISTFMAIRRKYDVFHFNSGSSLIHRADRHLNQAELPFYPEKARIFVTYNGCDARQKYPTMKRTEVAACHNPDCYGGICNSGRLDELRRIGIEKMGLYARHFWALNPDLLHFLPKDKSSFLPYTVSASPTEVSFPRTHGKLRIVHAPSERGVKGSAGILKAIERLQRERPDEIDFRLVEGVPNETALRVYQDADLVIDQVLVGWYGALAVEAMLMGKPVIARISRPDLAFLPPAMARDVTETLINSGPQETYETLVRCLADRVELRKKGEASLEYARRWHDPRYVAGLTKEKYEAGG